MEFVLNKDDLVAGVILQHSNGNYYQALAQTKIKTSQGWLLGLIYFQVNRESDNCFSADLTEKSRLYTRPLSAFDHKWKLERKASALRLGL